MNTKKGKAGRAATVVLALLLLVTGQAATPQTRHTATPQASQETTR